MKNRDIWDNKFSIMQKRRMKHMRKLLRFGKIPFL